MKLSLKIMTAVFIFAVIGIVGCSKNQLGLDVKESAFSETVKGNEIQHHEAKVKRITAILKSMKGVKIINNYTDSKIGLTGTLYEYVDSDGNTQRVVKIDKKPENIYKAWYPAVYTAKVVGSPDDYTVICEGASSDCFGWEGTIWWLNW